MKRNALSRWLAALICVAGSGCVAEAPMATQAPTPQSVDVQAPNQPVKSAITCGEFKALLKAGDKRCVWCSWKRRRSSGVAVSETGR
jgi:hypothetical protein